MVEFTLHAGLHKTATTSLQEHVFPNVINALYTGKSRHVMAASSRIHATNAREAHEGMLEMLRTIGPQPQRLPLHSCCYLLALLQDYLVATLARRSGTPDQLEPLFIWSQNLLNIIESKCDNPHMLYSCEGLLASSLHVSPEQKINKGGTPPLAYHRLLFPGKLNKVVLYLRSPVDYLFSRYVQIHMVRVFRFPENYKEPLLSIERYLQLNEQVWHSEEPHKSVFLHIFQPQLISYLRSLELPVVVRSYEKHICNNQAISMEFSKAFGLKVYNSERVDKNFRDKPLNTTTGDKDAAMSRLLQLAGHKNRASLYQKFKGIAVNHPLIQEAIASTVYPTS